MKKIRMLRFIVILTAVFFSSCTYNFESAEAEGNLKKIGVIHDTQSWEIYATIQTTIAILADEENVELIVKDANGDSAKQVEAIEDMIASGVQGIICVSIDSEQLEPFVQKTVEQGIAFISLFTEVPSATVNIRINEYEYGSVIGSLAGRWAQENFPGQQLEAAVLRRHDYRPGMDRSRGMREAFAKTFPTGRIVADVDSVDLDTARISTEKILEEHPNVKIFMAESDDTGAFGAYDVLKSVVAKEDYNKYCVIGGDGTTQGIMYVKEGGMYRGNIDILPLDLGVRAYNNIKDFVDGKEVMARQYMEFLEMDYETAVRKY